MTNPMLAELDGLRLSHAVCDDGWYSCPKSGECLDDAQGDDCNCGADTHNAKLDSLHATIADMAKRLEAAESDAGFLKVAETTLYQIATTPRNAGARRNANATMRFIETQRAAAIDAAQEGEG